MSASSHIRPFCRARQSARQRLRSVTDQHLAEPSPGVISSADSKPRTAHQPARRFTPWSSSRCGWLRKYACCPLKNSKPCRLNSTRPPTSEKSSFIDRSAAVVFRKRQRQGRCCALLRVDSFQQPAARRDRNTRAHVFVIFIPQRPAVRSFSRP
jgi:hypothetical protein